MVTRIVAFGCVLALAGAIAGCSGKEAAQRYLDSANRYRADGKYQEAIIEYRNALQANDSGEARFGLAEALAAIGNPEGAYREYVRAADLLPDAEEVQVKAATALLMAGQFEDVRTRVERVLERNPNSVEAQILLGNALAGLKDLDGAVQQIEEAIRLDPASAQALTNLGLLRVAQGQQAAARDAFEKAVQANPTSVQAWLALANFQWAVGVLTLAEESLAAALKLDPKNALANRSMANLYMITGRTDLAENNLKMVAEATNTPQGRFALSDYYARLGRFDAARLLLEPMARDDRTFPDAQTRLSQIDYAEGNRDRAHAALNDVFTRQPGHPPALVTKARWLVAEGQFAAALDPARAAVNPSPGDVAVRYLLGTIQAANGQIDDASGTFNEVLRLNPRAAAAQIQLSHLRLLRSEGPAAVELAEAALRNVPGSPEARLTLARSLVASRDMPRARLEVARLLADYPGSAAVHAVNGTLRLVNGETAAARAAYEQALRLESSSIAALTGLTVLDLQQMKPEAARARIETRVAASPNRPDLLLLAAKVYVAQRDLDKAEGALRRSIELDATTGEAYGILVEIYREQQKLEVARVEFDAIGSRNPKNVGARTISALLLHAQGKVSDAKQRYADILAVEPRAAVAANNLAWIYADAAENLDVAVQLAERAVEQLPDRAEIRDTLGWVYYRKQLPQLAIRPFEQAIAQQPDNPTFHYHLGLAHVKSGDRVRGRAAFEKALSLNPDFSDAKREIAYLQRP